MNTPIGLSSLEELVTVALSTGVPIIHISEHVQITPQTLKTSDRGEITWFHNQGMIIVSTIVDDTLYIGVLHIWQWNDVPEQTPAESIDYIKSRVRNATAIVHGWLAEQLSQVGLLVNGLPLLNFAVLASLRSTCSVLGFEEESKTYFRAGA